MEDAIVDRIIELATTGSFDEEAQKQFWMGLMKKDNESDTESSNSSTASTVGNTRHFSMSQASPKKKIPLPSLSKLGKSKSMPLISLSNDQLGSYN